MTTSQSSPVQIDKHERPLSAPLRLSFDYTRSVGPLLSQFFTALRERRILGVRGSDGRVHVPPAEFDPVTYDRLTEIVPVASVGTVVSWTWQSTPLEGQPLDRPFAWALIKLDGADTPLLHAVDAVTSDAISTGARVHAHWVDEPVGAITDIACFALGDRPNPRASPTIGSRSRCRWCRRRSKSSTPHRFPRASSCVRSRRASCSPRARGADAARNQALCTSRRKEADPATGLELDEFLELPDNGTVTTFAIINIPFPGQRIKPPYVAAYVLLDGADIPFLHLVTEIDPADVRMGMRVEAVWKPREEWGLGIDNIDYFRPTGEPDADYDSYKHHL